VLLGGAANLIRDPRGGRNFEYFSEDPLLTGIMAGSLIEGVQSRHIISTIKHFALNAQETDRVVLDARIDPAATRESDLLAFEIALERGRPGGVMCAYNQVNGSYSCENNWLLNEVLKTDWGYPYFVMSDWGAVHSTVRSAIAGLDQESGEQLDTENFFAAPLSHAIADGVVPEARLDDMARRILISIFAHGLADKTDVSEPVDFAASDRTALAIAREGTVLLRNQGLLPLPADTRSLVAIGAHADRGVPSGGGSSQVIPRGGIAAKEQIGENQAMVFDPGSPLEAIRLQFPHARVDFDDGSIPARAAEAAAKADAVILFVDQWMTESADAQSLNLPGEQDKLVEAVTRANPRTVVVLETGGPVLMPWLEKTAAVLEAWYPGQMGGEAIAAILSGAANPSGRLPVTFPVSEDQLPHPKIRGDPSGAPSGPVGRGGHYRAMFTAVYSEGAAVGYKWFFERGEQPLFPFGFGLSYSTFGLSELAANVSGQTVTARATVRNSGKRAGTAIPQFYLTGPNGANILLRLVGWDRVDLKSGEQRQVAVSIDPRLLATFDEGTRRWQIQPGAYKLTAGFDSHQRELTAIFELQPASVPP
jgi:beta-glucosidase